MACAKVISEFEVLAAGDIGRRRRWSDAEKVRIVEESLRGDRQGSATARRHGLSRSLLTRWRADYRAGRLGYGRSGIAFTAVTLAASEAPVPVPEAPLTAPAGYGRDGSMEIVLRNGRRMIVPTAIDPVCLARLLPVVEGA
jgi:transposase